MQGGAHLYEDHARVSSFHESKMRINTKSINQLKYWGGGGAVVEQLSQWSVAVIQTISLVIGFRPISNVINKTILRGCKTFLQTWTHQFHKISRSKMQISVAVRKYCYYYCLTLLL